MTPGKVEVDPDLVSRAAAIAAANGDDLQAIIERALTEYVDREHPE